MVSSRAFLLLFIFLNPVLLKAQEPTFIEPTLELFKTEYPAGHLELDLSDLEYSGDINGDSIPDFQVMYGGANLDTEDLLDFKYGVLFYLGSENSIEEHSVSLNFADYFSDDVNYFVPIGDLNGDGCDEHLVNRNTLFFDISCGEFTEVKTVPFPTSLSGANYTIEADINNDGVEDILIFNKSVSRDYSFEFEIVYGNENPDSLKLEKFVMNHRLEGQDSDRYYEDVAMTVVDLYGDESKELILVGRNQNFVDVENPLDLLILEPSDSTGFEVTLNYNIESEQSDLVRRIYVGDYVDGGLKELFIGGHSRTQIILEILESTNSLEVVSELNLKNVGFENQTLIPIEDFNGDGTYDFLKLSPEGGNELLLGTEDLGTFTAQLINFENRRILSQKNAFFNSVLALPTGFLGDINKDGFSDFQMSFVQFENMDNEINVGRGKQFINGNSEGFLTKKYELYTEEFPTQFPVATFNAGDFNNDGIEDYGVLFEVSVNSTKANRVEIFFGKENKQNWDQADLVFNNEYGYMPDYPAVGDFNGDGISDLVINFKNYNSGINFYYGSSAPDNDPDHFISFAENFEMEEFNEDLNRFYSPKNLGDINGDLVDDLGYSKVFSNPYKLLITFGGMEISNSENIEIELDNQSYEYSSLGDIDLDGINEFAVSQLSEIYIFESFNKSTNEVFNTEPEYVLGSSITSLFIEGIFLTGIKSIETGDYNGDNKLDLAVSFSESRTGSRLSNSFYDYEGGPSTFIYYADENFDNNHDKEIKIPLKDVRAKVAIDMIQEETQFIYYNRGGIQTIKSASYTADKLFIETSRSEGLTNAMILSIDTDSSSITGKTEYIFKSLNQNIGLGSYSIGDVSSKKSAIGDFDLDGKIEILLSQGNDPNYPEDPVLLFSTDLVATANEFITEEPSEFNLSQNYPNPFNPTTQINYSLTKSGEISLKVYDITGRLVSTLANEVKAAGTYTLNFDASNLSSGVYFYSLSSSEGIQTRKMTLIK